MSAQTTTLPPVTAADFGITDAQITAHLGGQLIVLVRRLDGRWTRRAYFGLPSAQRAADRARAKGHAAEVILCRLHPVVRIDDDELDA